MLYAVPGWCRSLYIHSSVPDIIMTESWKKIKSIKYGGSITVDIMQDTSLGLVWTLKIDTKDGICTIKNPHSQGNIPYLARIIRGIEDYLNLQTAKKNGIKLDIEQISKMWIDFVTYLYNNDILLSGKVALVESIPIEIKGLKLVPTVIPKEWGNPIKDGVIIHFSNLYIGDYLLESEPDRRRPCFRLSAYDADKFGKVGAKEATKYINLHPINDRELILKIMRNSVMIYPINTKFDGGFGNDLRVINRELII